MNEKDLQNINLIDMDTDFVDDEDTIVVVDKPSADKEDISDDHNSVTGIIIDLSDDDDVEVKTLKPLSVGANGFDHMEQDILNAKQGTLTPNQIDRADLNGINEIDMECSVGEDDDFDSPKAYFSPDDFKEYEQTLVNEDILAEKHPKKDAFIDQGKVEADYYDKLKKKHAKTNVKGAGYHIHLAGDPKAEMDMFNQENTGNAIPNATNASAASAGEGVTGSFGVSFGENKEKSNYRRLFEELLLITGFDCDKDNDGTYTLKDRCKVCPDIKCKDNDELFTALKPYVDDCFIYPFQVETKENIDDCKGWCDWFKSNKDKYPHFERDMKYCDLIANHSHDFIY